MSSLTDAGTSFRYKITTERDSAMRHREFLLLQKAAIERDLASIQLVIDGANAALDATDPEPILAMEYPGNVSHETPVTDTALRAVQSALDQNNPPPSPDVLPIPPFLLKPRDEQ